MYKYVTLQHYIFFFIIISLVMQNNASLHSSSGGNKSLNEDVGKSDNIKTDLILHYDMFYLLIMK